MNVAHWAHMFCWDKNIENVIGKHMTMCRESLINLKGDSNWFKYLSFASFHKFGMSKHLTLGMLCNYLPKKKKRR